MSNNIITPSQSGSLSGDSITNQFLCIYEYLCSNFDKRITTQSVYFDISKAFDRVWHRGLILKLVSIGIRGKLLKWFHSYLTDRTQAAVIKGEKSIEKKSFWCTPRICTGSPNIPEFYQRYHEQYRVCYQIICRRHWYVIRSY